VEAKKTITLPINIVGSSDISALLRELNSLNDFFVSAEARKSGTPIQPPRVTRTLDSLARENQYNLLDGAHRAEIVTHLTAIRQKAPKIHISFASEPSPKALERLLAWFRASIHPQLLLQVGLQPNIAAGCVLRTPNKFFDMSLRAYLEKQEDYLLELTKGAVNGSR
jgi:F0F1-type ATP synthase delta subunit